MAQTTPSAFMDALRADLAAEHERMQRDINRHFWAGGPPAKLTRIQRARNRLHWRIRSARTALGKRIAPWLDEGYY